MNDHPENTNGRWTAIIAGSYSLHALMSRMEPPPVISPFFEPNDCDIWVNCPNSAFLVMAAYDFTKEYPNHYMKHISVKKIPSYNLLHKAIQGIVEAHVGVPPVRIQMICWKARQEWCSSREESLARSVISSFDISVVKVAVTSVKVTGKMFLVDDEEVLEDVQTYKFSAQMYSRESAQVFENRVQKYKHRGFLLKKMKIAGMGWMRVEETNEGGIEE